MGFSLGAPVPRAKATVRFLWGFRDYGTFPGPRIMSRERVNSQSNQELSHRRTGSGWLELW
jgi:hypothetical protein